MSDLRIRDFDENIKLLLREEARREGVTLENFARQLLTEAALRKRRAYAAQVNAMREALRKEYGTLDDSTPFIRAERDARG